MEAFQPYTARCCIMPHLLHLDLTTSTGYAIGRLSTPSFALRLTQRICSMSHGALAGLWWTGSNTPINLPVCYFIPVSRKRAEYFSVIIPMLARDFSKRVVVSVVMHFCPHTTTLSERALMLSINMRVISYFMSIPLFLADDSDLLCQFAYNRLGFFIISFWS